jgi:hypothetical protein
VLVRQGRATPHIDAQLGVGGSISDRIVNHAGQSMRRFCVEAFDAATESLGFVLTDRAGNYKITGLSTGTYQISAAKCFGGNEAYTTRPRDAAYERLDLGVGHRSGARTGRR